MNFLNFTANNSQCILDCVQGPINQYFHNNYHLMRWPTNGTLLTINLVGLAAGIALCALNCCAPCCCARGPQDPREISPLFKNTIKRTSTADEETALTTPKKAPRSKRYPHVVAGKVATAARILGALTATGLAVGMSAWALNWIGLHNQQSPLIFDENLILACYKNCTP